MNPEPTPLQPDFNELARNFNSAAREISRLPNIPGFDQGTAILAQLEKITEGMSDLRNEVRDVRNAVRELQENMSTRFDAR